MCKRCSQITNSVFSFAPDMGRLVFGVNYHKVVLLSLLINNTFALLSLCNK